MVYSNCKIKILLLVLVSSSALQCTIGCSDCVNGFCTGQCYGRRKPDFSSCDRKTAPESENCLVYDYGYCDLCKPGYANSPNSYQCEKYSPEIPNCLGARKNQMGDIQCFFCNGGFPTTSGDSCQDFGGIGPGRNCMWGLRKNGNIECGRCLDGYVNQGGGCIKQIIQGCLKTDVLKTKCAICDIHDGWFMTNFEGKCSRYGVWE